MSFIIAIVNIIQTCEPPRSFQFADNFKMYLRSKVRILSSYI